MSFLPTTNIIGKLSGNGPKGGIPSPTNDPRGFVAGEPVAKCAKSQQQGVADLTRRRNFLDNLTSLDIFNQKGGVVAEGLRTLSKVSNIIRIGDSSLLKGDSVAGEVFNKISNTAIDAVETGGTIVMDAVGLGGVTAEVGNTLSNFSPEAFNETFDQAKSIYSRVKQGNLDVKDIPFLTSEFNNLGRMVGLPDFTNGSGQTAYSAIPKSGNDKEVRLCGASPYAVDLIRFAPKYKFMFIVDLTFSAEYAKWNEMGLNMAFVVKRSTRPQVEYDYEEINMYNFKTQVAKKTNYPPMTMAFYDDNKNNAHLFYTAHTRAMSPIANIKNSHNINNYEQFSMNYGKKSDINTFHPDSPTMQAYAASLGPLLNNTKSLISEIRLFHVFDYGRLMNVYKFYNPRITNMNPSELDMAETGDGCEYEFQFTYDGLHIEPGYSVSEGLTGSSSDYNIKYISGNRDTAIYPIDPIFDPTQTSSDNSQQSTAPTAQQQEKSTLGEYDFTGHVDASVELSNLNNKSSFEKGLDQVTEGVGDMVDGAYDALSDPGALIGGVSTYATGAVQGTADFISDKVKTATGWIND